MPLLVSLCMLALAVSLDGFGVGLTYGLRQMRIPLVSIGIISVCSGLAFYASMRIGGMIADRMAPEWASKAGALLLIAVGGWALFQIARSRRDRSDPPCDDTPVRFDTEPKKDTAMRIGLKRFGLVVRILRKPTLADLDRSGTISAREAMVLGTALSFDAFGAGVGAAWVGFAPFSAAVAVSLASGLCVALGLKCGFKFASVALLRKLALLPGCILILMGILKLTPLSA